MNILKEIKTLDSLDKFGNGVTLYVGEYSDNYSPSQDPQNADYSNRMTLVAVPTYGETLEGSYVDFMDAATVLDCKQKIDDGEKIVDSSAGLNQTRALNHFKLCPPDAGCSVNNVIWENL